MTVFSVTKIFGVDAVKTRVFYKKKDAEDDIRACIKLFVDDPSEVQEIKKENEEVYYIVNDSPNPTEYVAFILRRNEVR